MIDDFNIHDIGEELLKAFWACDYCASDNSCWHRLNFFMTATGVSEIGMLFKASAILGSFTFDIYFGMATYNFLSVASNFIVG